MSNAAEEAIVPFLGQVMEHLKVYLTAPDTEDGIRLKTQAIDTLSVFARKIGKSRATVLRFRLLVDLL